MGKSLGCINLWCGGGRYCVQCEPPIDRPTAPSASGGEAVARWGLLVGPTGQFLSLTYDTESVAEIAAKRGHPASELRAAPLFAHPARMPTREEALAALPRIMRHYENSPSLQTLEETWDQILALFHTGETKGDCRGQA